MGRLVDHDATGPRKLDESDIDPEKGDIAVCQCGLSAEYPFCDGTHRQTRDEDEDTCYRYVREDGELQRREVDHVEYTDGLREDFEDNAD
jgi:CDGSH-type Zn-finger protein